MIDILTGSFDTPLDSTPEIHGERPSGDSFAAALEEQEGSDLEEASFWVQGQAHATLLEFVDEVQPLQSETDTEPIVGQLMQTPGQMAELTGVYSPLQSTMPVAVEPDTPATPAVLPAESLDASLRDASPAWKPTETAAGQSTQTPPKMAEFASAYSPAPSMTSLAAEPDTPATLPAESLDASPGWKSSDSPAVVEARRATTTPDAEAVFRSGERSSSVAEGRSVQPRQSETNTEAIVGQSTKTPAQLQEFADVYSSAGSMKPLAAEFGALATSPAESLDASPAESLDASPRWKPSDGPAMAEARLTTKTSSAETVFRPDDRLPAAAEAELPESWESRQAMFSATRARIVVGEGPDRTALTIAVMKNGVTVQADTQTPEAAAALREASGDLDAALRDQGLSLADMSARHGGSQKNHDPDKDSKTTAAQDSQKIEGHGQTAAPAASRPNILAIA